jgi:hypothetical protein
MKTGLIKRSLLVGNPYFQPTNFESIATAIGTGSSGTITFNSIPSTYKHLQIRFMAKASPTTVSTRDIQIQFNSDTGNNYARHNLYGNGSTVSALGVDTSTSNFIAIQSSACNSDASLANMVGTGIIDIHNYASTTQNKTVRAINGMDVNLSNTGFTIQLTSGLWTQTSAINSITLALSSGNFTTQTKFALYGIKGS